MPWQSTDLFGFLIHHYILPRAFSNSWFIVQSDSFGWCIFPSINNGWHFEKDNHSEYVFCLSTLELGFTVEGTHMQKPQSLKRLGQKDLEDPCQTQCCTEDMAHQERSHVWRRSELGQRHECTNIEKQWMTVWAFEGSRPVTKSKAICDQGRRGMGSRWRVSGRGHGAGLCRMCSLTRGLSSASTTRPFRPCRLRTNNCPEPRITDPESFNGTHRTWRGFLLQCSHAFALRPSLTDKHKSLYIVGLLWGRALEWAQAEDSSHSLASHSPEGFLKDLKGCSIFLTSRET